jgi:hypothetical protein
MDPFDFTDFGSPRTNGRTTLHPPQAQRNSGFDPFAEASPRQTASFDAFGVGPTGTSPSTQGLALAGPPLSLLGLALTLAAAGAVLAGVWGSALGAAAVGWLLAGPAAIGVLALYTLVDTRRRTDAVYSAPSWTSATYWAVVAVCLIGIAFGAWYLALWAGRQ